MKKFLIVLVALFAMVAFVSGVVAQEKKAEKPAAAPEKEKVEKPKPPKALKASGTVVAYEKEKMIKVKVKDKEMAFDVTKDTKVKGEVKEGGKVTVMYKKEGDKMIATSISVPVPKKPKPEKKPEAKPEVKK